MSDLDDKLRAIPLRQDISPLTGEYNPRTHLSSAEIEMVKQAFHDAGYLKFPQSIQESRLMDAADVRMTGQEWYDRFKAELEAIHWYVAYQAVYNRSDVEEAARKAANINEQETH